MSESEVTDWFPPEIKPVRDGWYEVSATGGGLRLWWGTDAWFPRPWDGLCALQSWRWRGLAADPDAPTIIYSDKRINSRLAAHAHVGKTDGEETGPPVGDEYTIMSPGLPPLRGEASSAEALAGGEYTSDPINLAGHASAAQPRKSLWKRFVSFIQLICSIP